MLKILNYFKKIKKIFYSFFKNKRTLMLTEGIANTNEDISNDNNINDNLISSSLLDEKDKSDFFIVYENVKNGIIKLEDLLLTDMIKVQLMMQEESELLNKKTSNIENQIKNLNTERNILEKEEQYYIKKQEYFNKNK